MKNEFIYYVAWLLLLFNLPFATLTLLLALAMAL